MTNSVIHAAPTGQFTESIGKLNQPVKDNPVPPPFFGCPSVAQAVGRESTLAPEGSRGIVPAGAEKTIWRRKVTYKHRLQRFLQLRVSFECGLRQVSLPVTPCGCRGDLVTPATPLKEHRYDGI